MTSRWWGWILIIPLAIARLMMIMSINLEGLTAFGDFLHFYSLGSLPGWPYFGYWIEFPPLFSFVLEIIYRISSGQQHIFTYSLYFLLTLADIGNLFLFSKISEQLYALPGMSGRRAAISRSVVYLFVLMVLSYTWWYFDSLVVFFMLLGIRLIIERRPFQSGLAIGIGVLTKMFPGLVLLMVWRRWSIRRGLILAVSCFAPVVLVWGMLWLLSPQFTWASLISQGSKGSWETIWALVDQNFITGSFLGDHTRLDADAASDLIGNPPRISPWLRLVVFGGIGLAAIWRIRPQTDLQAMAVLGFGWALFMLWSPGWSPQWVLYLLPLILLILPERPAISFSLMMILVNLLEWPILLSRGFFWALPFTIILRTLLLVLLAVGFYQVARSDSAA